MGSGFPSGHASGDTGAAPMSQAGQEAMLLALCQALHAAAMLAQRQLADMPDYPTVAREAAAIEAILQPGEAIADLILNLAPATPGEHEAQWRARLWKRGDYIATCPAPPEAVQMLRHSPD